MRSLKIFLSHSSGDARAAQALHGRLRAIGIDSWLDLDALVPGQDWELEIRNAIRASDAILVCLTRASVAKSGFVQREIRFALAVAEEQPEGSIFLIPIRLDECDVPDALRRWQWVDYFQDGGFDRLLRALTLRAQHLGLTLSDSPAETTQARRSRFGGIASQLEAEASAKHAALLAEAQQFGEELTDLCQNMSQTQRLVNADPVRALAHIEEVKRQIEALREGLREFQPQAKKLRDHGIRLTVEWTQLHNAERGIAELDLWIQRLEDIPAMIVRVSNELGLSGAMLKTWIYIDEQSRRVVFEDLSGKGASFILESNGRIKGQRRS